MAKTSDPSKPRAFTIELCSPAPAATTMAAVLDLGAHQRLIPLTTISWSGPLRRGSRFVARTGLGPIAFDDAMEVLEYAAATATSAGACTIRKTGRLLGGEIDLSVTPSGDRSRVVWRQHITVRGLPRALNPVVRWVARAAYRSVLVKLVDRAE